jgi:hypothetical protein
MILEFLGFEANNSEKKDSTPNHEFEPKGMLT